MTPQVIVGFAFVLVGAAIKVADAAGLLPGGTGFVGEITNAGFLFLGKEFFQASAAMQAKRASVRPPAGGGA